MTSGIRNGCALAAALACMIAVGCGGQAGGSGASTPAPAAGLEPGAASPAPEARRIQVDEALLARIGVTEVAERPAATVLATTGKVQFNEDQKANIVAPVGGQLLGLNVKVGDTVNAGDTLFYVRSREIAQAISENQESRRDLDLADKTYTMTKDLFEHQAASRIALQQADNELAKAKTRLARTEETLSQFRAAAPAANSRDLVNARMPMICPMSGVVIERNVTDGQYLQPDSRPALVIADLSSVWVLADVFERDVHLVQPGQRAEVTATAYPDRKFPARVVRIHDVLDPQSRTLKVRFLVANPRAHLKPEMFASVTIFLNSAARAVTVPPKAVFTEYGRNFVYVAQGQRTFLRRAVELQAGVSGESRVMSGLKAGERVVSEGTLLVRQQEDKKE